MLNYCLDSVVYRIRISTLGYGLGRAPFSTYLSAVPTQAPFQLFRITESKTRNAKHLSCIPKRR